MKRLRSIDFSAMMKALEVAALPEAAVEESGLPRYDMHVFKSQLLQQGLLEQDVDLLIDAFNKSRRGIIADQAESYGRAVRMLASFYDGILRLTPGLPTPPVCKSQANANPRDSYAKGRREIDARRRRRGLQFGRFPRSKCVLQATSRQFAS